MVLKDKFKKLLGQLPGILLTAVVFFGYFHFFGNSHHPVVPDLSVPEAVTTKVGVLTDISGHAKSGGAITWKLFSGPAPSADVTLERHDRSTVHFVAPMPGDYKIIASTVAHGEAVTAFTTAHVLPYTPGPIPPGPGPGPGPTPPAPKFPDGKFKLAQTAYDLGVKVVSDQRAKAAAALGGSFRALAFDVTQNKFTDLKDLLVKSKDRNDQAIRDTIGDAGVSAWNGFGEGLKPVIYKLYSDKKINSLADMRDAYLEIAQGLEAIKQ